MRTRDVIVLGASAGGIVALRELLVCLSSDIPASLFVVVHGPGWADRNRLAELLQRGSKLTVRIATDGEPIERGVILLAPPSRHLIVRSSDVRLSHGPHENQWRPSIDVLFRSAAVAHGPRTIGVVLSGLLDDGTAGLSAIESCGGVALVQDPAEAEFPDMPLSAMRNVDSVKAMRIRELCAALERLTREPAGEPVPVSPMLCHETRIIDRHVSDEHFNDELGPLSGYTCPECGGPLRTAAKGPLRFRCRVGHAYSGLVLEQAARADIESSLWTAIRSLQQRANLDRSLAERESRGGRLQGADAYATRAAEAQSHINVLQELLDHLAD